jgi:glutamate dehydrogenase
VRDSFALITLNAGIDALDGTIPGAVQLGLYARLQELLLGRMVWFIRNADMGAASLATTVARFQGGIAELGANLAASTATALPPRWRADALVAQGVPEELADRLAGLDRAGRGAGHHAGGGAHRSTDHRSGVHHFAVAESFGLGALLRAASDISTGDYYERLALDRALGAIGRRIAD